MKKSRGQTKGTEGFGKIGRGRPVQNGAVTTRVLLMVVPKGDPGPSVAKIPQFLQRCLKISISVEPPTSLMLATNAKYYRGNTCLQV